MTGDLPSADVKPPEEVLFICKLNPVTTDADLQIIFSRFGQIQDCYIARDAQTGASLCYAFLEVRSLVHTYILRLCIAYTYTYSPSLPHSLNSSTRRPRVSVRTRR